MIDKPITGYSSHNNQEEADYTSTCLTNLSLIIPNIEYQQGLIHIAGGKLKNHLALSCKVECFYTQQIYSVYTQFL